MKCYILSGEGDYGTWSQRSYTSRRGIQQMLSRERIGGRWARAFLPVGDGFRPGTVVEVCRDDGAAVLRELPPQMIEERR